MPFPAKKILALIIGLAAMQGLGAQILPLTSVYDTTPPAGQSYFIGFAGSSLPLVVDVTVAESYKVPLYTGTGLTFKKIFDVSADISNMETNSLVTQYSGNNLFFTSFAAFTNTVTSYTWNPSSLTPQVTLYAQSINLDQMPGGMAVGATGQIYFSTDSGIHEYANPTAIPTTFANSGLGQLSGSGALAVGPNGTVYALDPGNNRIAIYSATGTFEAAIPLTGTTASTALAVSNSGLVFTANGNGGGNIYSTATDALLDSFSSSAQDGAGFQGSTSLYLDPNNELYLYDSVTGFHVFDTSSVPEPGERGAAGGHHGIGAGVFAAAEGVPPAAQPGFVKFEQRETGTKFLS